MDRGFDYLTETDKIIIAIFALAGLTSYMIVIAYNAYPKLRLFGRPIEEVYYSTGSIFIRKLYTVAFSSLSQYSYYHFLGI